MQFAWFREIDAWSNENLNFDSPAINIRPNASETIPIDQTGFNTNPKGGNRPWRMQWAWFREIDVLKNENLNFDSSQAKIRSNSSETIPIDQTGTDTNPKGGNRLWRMQWAWFREIDVLKNENLDFDSPQAKIRPNSSETIPIDQMGFNTNPKGGNRPWRMQWAWLCEIDVLKNENHNFHTPKTLV